VNKLTAYFLMLVSCVANAQIAPTCGPYNCAPPMITTPLAPAAAPSGFLVGSQQIGPNAYLCKYQVGGQFVLISHNGQCPYSL
jgi:hypothetical protein